MGKIYTKIILIKSYLLISIKIAKEYKSKLAILIGIFILSGLKYKELNFIFLGLTNIIVYVGAIAILFLFVIKKTESGRTPGLIKGDKDNKLLGIKIIFKILGKSILKFKNKEGIVSIYEIYENTFATKIIQITDIKALGYVIYNAYPLGIILIGIQLFVVLIAVIVISNKNSHSLL